MISMYLLYNLYINIIIFTANQKLNKIKLVLVTQTKTNFFS